jgi:hypothetical protein
VTKFLLQAKQLLQIKIIYKKKKKKKKKKTTKTNKQTNKQKTKNKNLHGIGKKQTG